MKRRVISGIIFVLSIFGLLQMYMAHRLSTVGIELTKIDRESITLQSENEDLRHKIASSSSLTAIATKAKELGFETASFYYIEQPPVALKP